MRIEIDIPDWCDGRHIYILAGIEMAAYKLHGENSWNVKVERCNQCGKCCSEFKRFYFPVEHGVCTYLLKNNTCSLGVARPHVCGTSLTRKSKDRPYCTVEYKAV